METRATPRESEGGGEEGDGEKGIRAGITLGDCGIVNPCRVARAPLISFPDYFSLSLSLSFSLSTPTLSVASIARLLPLSSSPVLSSSYPNHGLVRHWNIEEHPQNRRRR